MRVFRTALAAVGALAMSVPLLAQDSRYGWDRSRVERNRDTRTDGRTDVRKEKSSGRSEVRPETRVENRDAGRGENRMANRPENRGDTRGMDRAGTRSESRNAPAPDVRYERRERRDEPRVIVRAPDMGRDDRRDGRTDSRYAPYGGRAVYRFGDRDFRSRDVFVITAWLRDVGRTRLSVYGDYGRDRYAVRYEFRPGLYLAMSVYSRLDPLPYELEVELGELPWYLERRIYGRTVLVVDVRTRMVVDVYDIDY